MNPMISIAMIYLALPVILMTLNYWFTLTKPDNEKLSPYECGFDPLKTTRPPFSIRFFLSSNPISIIWPMNRITLAPTLSHSTSQPNSYLHLGLYHYIITSTGFPLWMNSG
uniref:NADH dehydrogenase subunit 3 n=1 Tax=Geoclemys hamiltonii TaxID=260639 RepID=UPI0021143AB3|nr:NADH dehydrogenase subunit 3 [Geoclemys hamiltonii]USL48211.1 NADH dehydrogenase subunit 3 [Geoclemys hamiltonii]WBR37758.1 NADH dehydrogenase subunit 3 [Geoclemys hamiltonii]